MSGGLLAHRFTIASIKTGVTSYQHKLGMIIPYLPTDTISKPQEEIWIPQCVCLVEGDVGLSPWITSDSRGIAGWMVGIGQLNWFQWMFTMIYITILSSLLCIHIYGMAFLIWYDLYPAIRYIGNGYISRVLYVITSTWNLQKSGVMVNELLTIYFYMLFFLTMSLVCKDSHYCV